VFDNIVLETNKGDNMMDRNLVILSGELASATFSGNRQRTTTLRGMLEDLNFEFLDAKGYFCGMQEDSFVVFYKNSDEYIAVKDFAFKNFDQECILHYTPEDKEACLVFPEESSQVIGDLVEVNPKMIEVLDNFTIVNNRVFTTTES
jgi:hypothetical protein